MRKYWILLLASIITLTFLISGCNLPLLSNEDSGESVSQVIAPTATFEPTAPTEESQATSTQDDEIESPSTRLVTFDQLGISLEVPSELYVYKDPLLNYDDPSKLEAYIFEIQNYGYRGGPSSGDFQIYGILQYTLRSISWEEFAENTNSSTTNAYTNEIEINGLRGFDTQISGERPRFVYQFLINGQVLRLAVSAPTEENKALADQIVSTLLYEPEKFNNISHVQKIIEPKGYYQIYLPDDWDFTFIPPANIQLSGLEASSPDAEVVVEEVEGPHSSVLYKNGVLMNFVIMNDDSAIITGPVTAAGIKSSYQVMYSGIEMMDYIFVAPSTVEGEHRQLRFLHNGLSYTLTFSYAPGTDQNQIEWIIRNLELEFSE